jgi:hypothetical protein
MKTTKTLIAALALLLALPLTAQNLQQKLNEARTAAKAGKLDEAFTALRQLTDNGFGGAEMLNADNDLLALRTDPRWTEAIAAARRNAHPCTLASEYRQFDYWLGEWNVEANGQRIATSSIQAILDDCVVFENYHSLRYAYDGKSFSIYDIAKKHWEQRYVDTAGASHEWVGGLEGDHMRFFWHHNDAAGKPVVERMTYLKEGLDKVRQLIEASSDDGKTWTTTYDGLYTRRR